MNSALNSASMRAVRRPKDRMASALASSPSARARKSSALLIGEPSPPARSERCRRSRSVRSSSLSSVSRRSAIALGRSSSGASVMNSCAGLLLLVASSFGLSPEPGAARNAGRQPRLGRLDRLFAVLDSRTSGHPRSGDRACCDGVTFRRHDAVTALSWRKCAGRGDRSVDRAYSARRDVAAPRAGDGSRIRSAGGSAAHGETCPNEAFSRQAVSDSRATENGFRDFRASRAEQSPAQRLCAPGEKRVAANVPK